MAGEVVEVGAAVVVDLVVAAAVVLVDSAAAAAAVAVQVGAGRLYTVFPAWKMPDYKCPLHCIRRKSWKSLQCKFPFYQLRFEN